MRTIKQRPVDCRLYLQSPKCHDADSLMKRAVMVVQGLLFLSAVVPGVAVAGLSAASVDFGDVQQGVSVTKSVTVTNTAPGFHYLLDPSGSGSVTTVVSGSCPSGDYSEAFNTCQIQVTLLTEVIGSGTDSVDMGYQYEDMPFSANEAVSTASFTILATYSVVAPDSDSDGVANDVDECSDTPAGEAVDAQGCAQSQKDDDGDGVANDVDECSNTPPGESVNSQGCAQSQADDDDDGVANDVDQCPNTPAGESVDARGCAQSQIDDDGDGVANDVDECSNTPPGESVDAQGCAQSEQADAPQTGLPIWLLYEATK